MVGFRQETLDEWDLDTMEREGKKRPATAMSNLLSVMVARVKAANTVRKRAELARDMGMSRDEIIAIMKR